MVATKIEGQAVAAVVWAALNGDTGAGGVSTMLGGRIYRDRVPQASTLPAATVTLVSSVSTNTLGGRRVVERTVVDVHLIGDGMDYSLINPAAFRADQVIQNAGGTDSGVRAVELVREQTTAYIEDDAGRAYAHIVMTFATPAYAT